MEQLLGNHLVRAFPFRDVEPGGRTRTLWGLSCWPGWWITATWRSGWSCPLHKGQVANDGAIFHAKEGIIEDRPGQRLAFSDSVNETPNG